MPEFTLLLTGSFEKDAQYSCWRSRGSRDWLLFYTSQGAGRIADRKSARNTVPGELILCPPGNLHDYRTAPEIAKWRFVWAHFHPQPSWLGWLASLPDWACGWSGVVIPPETRPQLEARLEEMVRLRAADSALETQLALNALEEVILRAALIATGGKANPADQNTELALQFIAANLHRAVSLAEIAEASGQSISRLKSVFPRIVGATVGDYMERRRLNRASELLQATTLNIKEVAGEVGFSSPFHFSARFKRRFGKCPRDFRQER